MNSLYGKLCELLVHRLDRERLKAEALTRFSPPFHQLELEDKLDLWLISGAERFQRDPELGHALLHVARHEDSRRCLVLLDAILETPGLADRLLQVLQGCCCKT